MSRSTLVASSPRARSCGSWSNDLVDKPCAARPRRPSASRRAARDPSVVASVRDADTATCHAIGRATPGTIERRQSHAVHSGNLPCLCRSELTARSGCTTGECSEHPFTYRCPSAASSPPLPSGSSRATASTSPPLPSASSRATAFSSRHTGALGRTKRGGPELCNSRPV